MSAAHLSRIDRLKQLEACLPVEGPVVMARRICAASSQLRHARRRPSMNQ
jgi:hypothetical protein